jgi:3-hydroxyacyl-CoA dehydrogenase
MTGQHGVASAAASGLGTKGRGITQIPAAQGIPTLGFDSRLPETARRSLLGADCVQESVSLDDAIDGADIVFKAVSEDLAGKATLLCPTSTSATVVIASTTSTFLPSVLAGFMTSPECFLAFLPYRELWHDTHGAFDIGVLR